MSQLWQDSQPTPFVAINRSHVLIHVRERTPHINPPAFIGWRIHPSSQGFPDYYFDTGDLYWRLYKPGKNALLIQNLDTEERNQTRLLESFGYSVTSEWSSREALRVLADAPVWDLLIIHDLAFTSYGREWMRTLEQSATPLRWVVFFSYASSLNSTIKALMEEARSRCGAIFIHQSQAVEGLRQLLQDRRHILSHAEQDQSSWHGLRTTENMGFICP